MNRHVLRRALEGPREEFAKHLGGASRITAGFGALHQGHVLEYVLDGHQANQLAAKLKEDDSRSR